MNSIQYCLKNSITTGRKSSDRFMAKCDHKELSSMFDLFGPPQTNEKAVRFCFRETERTETVIFYI